jgi:ubiquinone biosynthesis protein
MEILIPYQQRIIERRLSPRELFKRARHNVQDWAALVEMAPHEIAELLKQIKGGKFDVHLEHRKLDPVVNRLVLGVLTAALFVGSAMILSSDVPPTFHGVSIAGSAGCLIAFAMGFRLVRAIQRSGNIESKRSDS